MPTWSNAGSLPPGSLPRNISAKSSAIAIFGPSPSFLEENENPTPTPRRWRNMKLSRSQPSTKLGTPSGSRGFGPMALRVGANGMRRIYVVISFALLLSALLPGAEDFLKAPRFPNGAYFRHHFAERVPHFELRGPERLEEFMVGDRLELSL